VSLLLYAFRNAPGISYVAPFMGINGSGYQYDVRSNREGCTVFFFVTRLKLFLAAVHTSTGTNMAILFLDDVHEGRKGLLAVFGGGSLREQDGRLYRLWS
jgi:hypothetical protein